MTTPPLKWSHGTKSLKKMVRRLGRVQLAFRFGKTLGCVRFAYRSGVLGVYSFYIRLASWVCTACRSGFLGMSAQSECPVRAEGFTARWAVYDGEAPVKNWNRFRVLQTFGLTMIKTRALNFHKAAIDDPSNVEADDFFPRFRKRIDEGDEGHEDDESDECNPGQGAFTSHSMTTRPESFFGQMDLLPAMKTSMNAMKTSMNAHFSSSGTNRNDAAAQYNQFRES